MAQRGKQEMKGPTSGPVWGGEAPAAPDALPDLLPPCRARSSWPALFSIAMTLIGQRESSGVSQEGPQMDSSSGTESPPGVREEVPFCPTKRRRAKKRIPHPVLAGDSRVALASLVLSQSGLCHSIFSVIYHLFLSSPCSFCTGGRASNGNLPQFISQSPKLQR